MDQKELQEMNWNRFLEEWGNRFEDARHILRYLDSCPDILAGLEMGEVIDPEAIDTSQEDWVRLCMQFDHPMEQEFFKPWWVPVTRDEYDYFIDLSEKHFPIFNMHFYFLEPYGWQREFVVEDISVILLAEEEKVDLQEMVDKNEQEMWKTIERKFDERLNLFFEGKLEVKPLEHHEIWPDEDDEAMIEIPPRTLEDTVTLPGVKPPAVGLFPYELPVRLVRLDKNNGDVCRHTTSVKTIRDLMVLIRHESLFRVEGYRVEFLGHAEGSIEFKKDKLVLSHLAPEMLDHLFDELEKMK